MWESGDRAPCNLNFGIRLKQEVFLISIACKLAVGPIQPPVECVTWVTVAEVQQSCQSQLSGARVKNAW